MAHIWTTNPYLCINDRAGIQRRTLHCRPRGNDGTPRSSADDASTCISKPGQVNMLGSYCGTACCSGLASLHFRLRMAAVPIRWKTETAPPRAWKRISHACCPVMDPATQPTAKPTKMALASSESAVTDGQSIFLSRDSLPNQRGTECR